MTKKRKLKPEQFERLYSDMQTLSGLRDSIAHLQARAQQLSDCLHAQLIAYGIPTDAPGFRFEIAELTVQWEESEKPAKRARKVRS